MPNTVFAKEVNANEVIHIEESLTEEVSNKQEDIIKDNITYQAENLTIQDGLKTQEELDNNTITQEMVSNNNKEEIEDQEQKELKSTTLEVKPQDSKEQSGEIDAINDQSFKVQSVSQTTVDKNKNGWHLSSQGNWQFFKQGIKVTNAWARDSIGWCYLDSEGNILKNAVALDSIGITYLNNSGYWDKTPGWKKDTLTNRWLYIGANGYAVRDTWKADSTGLAYIGLDGYWYTAPGWLYDKAASKWAYIGDNGYAVRNTWTKDSRGLTYIDAEGYWHTRPGWLYDSAEGKWAYIDDNGYALVDTWQKDSKGWCYIMPNGFWLDHEGEAPDSHGIAIIGKDGYWTGKYKEVHGGNDPKVDINITYTYYDATLLEQLDKQMKANPQTDYYGGGWKNADESEVRFFLDPSNFAKDEMDAIRVTASSLNLRREPITSSPTNIIRTLSKGEVYPIIKEENGWYKILATGVVGWVSGAYIEVTTIESNQMFQFLDLSKTNNISVNDLNKFLQGMGILEGRGESFSMASKTHGVNEIYLISHAILETGRGRSHLSTGVLVDDMGRLIDLEGRYIDSSGKLIDSNGQLVNEEGYLLDENGDVTGEKGIGPFKTDGPIITVYNMFGIGAYDSDPLKHGAKKAFDEGWTNPDAAIIGGAKFVSHDYIYREPDQQNTLYKMRWNPDNNLPYASHQYATDIAWAYKQVSSIKKYYDQCTDGYTLYFDIPVFQEVSIN